MLLLLVVDDIRRYAGQDLMQRAQESKKWKRNTLRTGQIYSEEDDNDDDNDINTMLF